MSGWRRSALAGLLLLGVYVGLSLLNSPRGFLGTDTGGKVATLRVMDERGRFDPDLGYWAEPWDPEGALHPLALTAHLPSGAWVNVTTLPALFVGWELYRLGGYRAALLVPMAGSIAAAFAGRALARRLGADGATGWRCFWLVGLASPLAIYALDFWEHSLGVALVGWATVVVVAATRSDEEVGGRIGALRPALLAGVLVGAAATMRTEALVYGLTLGLGLVVPPLVGRRGVGARVVEGVAYAGGLVATFLAGAWFEGVVLGSAIRPARAAGTAAGAPTVGFGVRLQEAVETTVGVGGRAGLALGAVLTVALAASVIPTLRRRSSLLADGALGASVVGYLAVFASGLAFVPGLAPTTPFAVAGLLDHEVGHDDEAPRRRRRRRIVWWIAVGAIPLVLAVQFTGGAGPQWGGRYLLPSTFLLLVLGATAVGNRPLLVRRGFTAFAVAVTAFGLVWLHVRSNDVDRTIAALDARPEQVVVSSLGHLAREGGATYGDRRWLTRYEDTTDRQLAAILDGAGITSVAAVRTAHQRERPIPGFTPTSTTTLRLFDGVDLEVTSYRRAP